MFVDYWCPTCFKSVGWHYSTVLGAEKYGAERWDNIVAGFKARHICDETDKSDCVIYNGHQLNLWNIELLNA